MEQQNTPTKQADVIVMMEDCFAAACSLSPANHSVVYSTSETQ